MRIMDLYLVSETGREKKMKQPTKQTSGDESRSPETQLLTRKDGGIKREKMKTQRGGGGGGGGIGRLDMRRKRRSL